VAARAPVAAHLSLSSWTMLPKLCSPSLDRDMERLLRGRAPGSGLAGAGLTDRLLSWSGSSGSSVRRFCQQNVQGGQRAAAQNGRESQSAAQAHLVVPK